MGNERSNRRLIQKQHEQAVVANFLAYYNQANGTQFVVVAEPEPPEAVARDGNDHIWLEVTDVFWPKDYAKDLYSFATPNEEHQPVVKPTPFMKNMDEQFAQEFIDRLRAKLSKSSYKPFYESYGPGLLLIGMWSPFFDEKTIELMRLRYKVTDWTGNLGYFGSVFVAEGTNFYEWQVV